jgi:hypothetical protein
MSIVVRFSPTSMTAEQYDKSLEAMEKAKLVWPPPGLDYHVCFFGSDGYTPDSPSPHHKVGLGSQNENRPPTITGPVISLA